MTLISLLVLLMYLVKLVSLMVFYSYLITNDADVVAGVAELVLFLKSSNVCCC